MNFKNMLFFLGLALVVASSNVYAVDPSICSSGENVALHHNGSLKSCELKDDYEVNNIQCGNRSRVSFYDNALLSQRLVK